MQHQALFSPLLLLCLFGMAGVSHAQQPATLPPKTEVQDTVTTPPKPKSGVVKAAERLLEARAALREARRHRNSKKLALADALASVLGRHDQVSAKALPDKLQELAQGIRLADLSIAIAQAGVDALQGTPDTPPTPNEEVSSDPGEPQGEVTFGTSTITVGTIVDCILTKGPKAALPRIDHGVLTIAGVPVDARSTVAVPGVGVVCLGDVAVIGPSLKLFDEALGAAKDLKSAVDKVQSVLDQAKNGLDVAKQGANLLRRIW